MITPMSMRPIQFAFCLLIVPLFSFSQNGNNLFNPNVIHEIRLFSDDPGLWEALLVHYNESQQGLENVYNPVEMVIDGTTLSTVGLRIKGFSSAWGTAGRKKPFRLDFNEFVPGQEFDGIKKISLNNAWADPSAMRDVIAYNIMRTEGVAASRTSYARLYINEEYFGLYIIAEQIDKTFLKTNFGDNDGNLYKCIGWSELAWLGPDKNAYKPTIELKTNETEDDWTGFIEFVKYLNKHEISDAEYRSKFPQIFDIPAYFKVLAIDILLNNWDSYYDHGRNFYIYDNPETGKMTWIPWDYNLSFSPSQINILATNPGSQAFKPLIRNLLNDPEMVRLLVKAYEEILEDNFTSERLEPLINQTKQLIREEVGKDPNYAYSLESFDASLEETAVIHHNDTFGVTYDLDQIYIVTDWNNIPDSILQSGKLLLDTTQFLYTRFDTLDFGNGPEVFLYGKQAFIWDETIIGLKGFVRSRIAQVKDEISRLEFVTDIEDPVDEEDFVVFPNPASRELNFSGRMADLPFEAAVFDATGKKCLLTGRGKKMSIEDLSPGLYLLRVQSSLGHTTRKFFKTHSLK